MTISSNTVSSVEADLADLLHPDLEHRRYPNRPGPEHLRQLLLPSIGPMIIVCTRRKVLSAKRPETLLIHQRSSRNSFGRRAKEERNLFK